MGRLITAIAATFLVVVFAISNSHHVTLSFGIGTPIQIRLVFLLMTTFVIGALMPVFSRMFINIKRSREAELVQKVREIQDLAAVENGDVVNISKKKTSKKKLSGKALKKATRKTKR